MSPKQTSFLANGSPALVEARETRLLVAFLFALALAINLCGIGWGLPNGNDTWANDAIRPGAPLSVLHRVLIAEPWNSGWFWFKYPLGHVWILGAAYAPYLGWLVLTGGLSAPTSSFPYGMADPEATLAMLAILGRLVSAAMGAGLVVIAFFALRRSFGRLAAIGGALTTAFCYPVVYYGHTTNVEIPYLFWLLLAFLAGVRLTEGDLRKRWWIGLAVGAAMSVSTKELGAGFFLGIPPVVALAHFTRRRPWGELVRGGAIAAAATFVVMVVANNVALNPSGFLNRIGFLTQTLPPEVALEYAPYYFPIELGTGRGFAAELAQFSLASRRLFESLGPVTGLLAVIGLVIAAKRRPWWAILAAACALTFYLFGARAMLSLSMRYVMPLAVLATMLAGISLGDLLEPGRWSKVRRALAAAAGLYIVIYGGEVDRMLVGDARYAAEAWLRQHVSAGQVIEVYQRPLYLPRMPADARVHRVDFEERTVEAFRERSPEYVVLSSAGLAGMTVVYKTDWSSEEERSDEWIPSRKAVGGRVMSYKRRSNVELLEGLQSGTLGYREAAAFSLEAWIERPLIQSLNPAITIYRRSSLAEAAGAS